jgi:trehalose 6-phosphate synthase/phosphatase
MESLWIGWPGGEVKTTEDRAMVAEKLKALGSIPVFLSAELCDHFYNGFCNDLLWPLFHYIPLPIDAIIAHNKQFKAYQKANAAFAHVVLDEFRDGDMVWVHDYHLMLLPSFLRQAKPQMKIGFFFHTPFPSSEIYRVIPSRDELLCGVLSANLLGFHTHDYSRHFQGAATHVLGAQCSNERITLNGAISSLGTFPIGIDPKRFLDALDSEKVQVYVEDFQRQFAGKRILLGIDRLDHIKGISQKLHALELFFDRNPHFVGEVVLVQIAVPSRTDVVEYQRLKVSIHELVGRINGRFGSVASVPVHYLDQPSPSIACALSTEWLT